MVRYLTYLLLLSILSGCITFSPESFLDEKRKAILSLGKSDRYTAGYIDGCASGRYNAGDDRFDKTKNVTRFNADRLYATGWQTGENECRIEFQNIVKDRPKVDFKRNNSMSEKQRIWDELKK